MKSNFISYYFKTLILLLCTVIGTHLGAQSNSEPGCATQPGPNAIGELPPMFGVQPIHYYLRLYVYILRKSDGTDGMSFQDVDAALARLDNDFAQFNIHFVRGCPIEIKDDVLYAGGTGNNCLLFYDNGHPYRHGCF